MLKQQIKTLIEKELLSLDIKVPVLVDYPTDPLHGDYTTNVALIAAKKLGKNPKEFAEDLRLKIKDLRMFEKIEVAGPGFINFWVKNDALISSNTALDPQNGSFYGKKIMVEFTDPNPFKEFHIGHLYSNIVGESISRLLEANGATVQRVDYFGDVGMHVAKSIWGLQKMMHEDNVSLEHLGEKELKERISYLGKAYARGATAYEEDEKAKEEIQNLNRLVYIAAQKMWKEVKGIEPKVDYKQDHKIDTEAFHEVYHLYTVGREWSMEYFEEIFRRLGTNFDGYYPESIAGERGYQLVLENKAKGIFVESQGAIVFPGEKFNLHTRVFINQLGLPTYEAKELGLAPWKYEDFPYDLSIIITGNEVNEYFKVLLTALNVINAELGAKAKHFSHGMVKLPEGKMSSRTGKIITGEWLLDEAKQFALKLSDSEDVAELVGVGAIKYALLKNGVGKDVSFSFEESISFEGNAGPYLQYTYARTQSVLRKGLGTREQGLERQVSSPKSLTFEDRDVLRLLVRFPEIVAESGERFAPQILCTYLFELAQAFNLFYQKSPILKAEVEVRNFRLHLTAQTGEVLQNGLHLLGIAAPEHM